MIDFCLTKEAAILSRSTDLVMQQIDMLFDTSPKEVLGEPLYGSDYEKFLWDLSASATTISNYIENNINNNVALLGHTVEVNVEVFLGTQSDIILVDINITAPDGQRYGKTYNIQ